jgi:hypothetical protein
MRLMLLYLQGLYLILGLIQQPHLVRHQIVVVAGFLEEVVSLAVAVVEVEAGAGKSAYN